MKININDTKKVSNGGDVLMTFSLTISDGEDAFRIFNVKLVKDVAGNHIITFHKYLTDNSKTYEVVYPEPRGNTRKKILDMAMEEYYG